MADLEHLTKLVVKFRDERDWKQFHNPKDVAISLTLEAAELLEHFQWKSKKEIARYVKTNKGAIGEEIADVLYHILLLCHDLGIPLRKTFENKLRKSGRKYPIEKSRGNHKKYTEL